MFIHSLNLETIQYLCRFHNYAQNASVRGSFTALQQPYVYSHMFTAGLQLEVWGSLTLCGLGVFGVCSDTLLIWNRHDGLDRHGALRHGFCWVSIQVRFSDSSRCCAVIQLCPLGSKEESQNGENSSIEDSQNGQDVGPPDVTGPKAVLPRGLTADLSDLVLVPAAWVDHTGQEHEDRWNQFHNTAKVEDECFLEAEEKQQSSHSDQHQEGRNSNEKRRGSERIVENGIKSGERPTAHVDSLGVVGVAVLEHTNVAKPRRRGGISNPLWLDEGHEIQNTPNNRK